MKLYTMKYCEKCVFCVFCIFTFFLSVFFFPRISDPQGELWIQSCSQRERRTLTKLLCVAGKERHLLHSTIMQQKSVLSTGLPVPSCSRQTKKVNSPSGFKPPPRSSSSSSFCCSSRPSSILNIGASSMLQRYRFI